MPARFFPACCSLLLVAAALAGAADPADGLEARFRQLDANHDGQLTRAEAGQAPWFDRLDRRGTGVLTRADIRAFTRDLARERANPAAAPAPAAIAPAAAPAAMESPRQGPVIVKPAERGVGRLVPDLTRGDFEIYDDGKLQATTVFSTEEQPITIIVMLDRSGSMEGNFGLVQDAAEAFVK
jgi:hypothetical protein